MRSLRLFRIFSCVHVSQHILFLLLVPALSMPLSAQQSDWLKVEKGSEDAVLGVELLEIKTSQENHEQVLFFSVPKEAVADPSDIEEVIVIGTIGEDDAKKEQVVETQYSWGDALDADHYGLQIRISNSFNYPIRLFFQADNSLDIDP